MAGKLSIRRVGNYLPSMCLAGVLLVIAIISWLCTAGLPGCALRYIEEEAAKNGISLKIGKIRLSPSSGMAIKAEDVVVEQAQPGAAPITLKTRKVQVAFSLSRMMAGEFRPVNIRLTDGRLNFPLSQEENDALTLHDIDIYTVFLRGGKGINTNISAVLNHITLETRILLTDPERILSDFSSTETESGSTFQLSELRPYLKDAKQQLEAQNWNDQQHPHLKVAAVQEEKWRVEFNGTVPSYEFKQFHFRDAQLTAHLEEETITIDHLSFRTIDPDTTVALQGGYDWLNRELEFNAKSTAPLIRIAYSYLDAPSREFLSKLHSAPENTPTIELDGKARLAENFALNSISLRGKIEHRHLNIGSTPVEQLYLSFFLQDGRFNLDSFKLQHEQGQISATARAEGESGHAEINLSLPDEIMLALVRDLSGNDKLILPQGIDFEDNISIHARGEMSLEPFVSGKTRFEDLIPSLQACSLQLNTGKTHVMGTDLQNPAITLKVHGIGYNNEAITAESIQLDALLGTANAPGQDMDAEDLLLNVKLQGLYTPADLSQLNIQQAELRASATTAQYQTTRLEKLHSTAALGNLGMRFDNITESLRSGSIALKLNADSFAHADTRVKEIYLDANIPEGLNLADAWKNMQKGTNIIADVKEIRHGADFVASDTKVRVNNTGPDTLTAEIASTIGAEQLNIQGAATLLNNDRLKLDEVSLRIPAAAFAPIWGGEPLAELKLPGLIEAEGDATVNTTTGALEECHYAILVPRLERVCHNVHVHKGMEIPIALEVRGDFKTDPDGCMQYRADALITHEHGEAMVHVTGNPLKECNITGTNTIPVNIINALIDNADAHWIMRDFRCTPGVTRNVIKNINTTIRYDKGIYVHALCDAELYNMEFLLGAIRDKEDTRGNPTGEEYLRTDLSPNPYSKIKEGKCGVEVLVQMDCVDEKGNPLPERLRINLNNPDLLYDNKPWLKRMGFKKGAATSRITGEAVRFNIENNTISLHKLKGNCYPAYSIGMYYAPIQHFLEDIILKDPVDIRTDYCIFPLSRNCDVPMQGLIHAEAATGAGFQFLGTTIPFTNFSGFINISDVDVYLDRMNAQCWGGSIAGALRIGFSGKHTTLDGYFNASNMDLKDIVASYGTDFTPAICNGYIRFQAAKPELEDVRGYGQVHLKDGDLMQIGLFRPIGALLSDMPGNLAKLQQSVNLKQEDAPPSWADKVIRALFDTGSSAIDTMQDSAYKVPFANHFLRYGIDEAFARFDISNGHLISRDMKAKGYNLNVGVQLDIDLDKLTLTGDLWPKISSVPTVLISPVTILSDFLIDINLYGDLISPQWEFGLSKKLKATDNSLSPEPQKEKELKTE